MSAYALLNPILSKIHFHASILRETDGGGGGGGGDDDGGSSNSNLGVTDDMSFNKAFSTARSEAGGGGGTFSWGGNEYSTATAEEAPGLSGKNSSKGDNTPSSYSGGQSYAASSSGSDDTSTAMENAATNYAVVSTPAGNKTVDLNAAGTKKGAQNVAVKTTAELRSEKTGIPIMDDGYRNALDTISDDNYYGDMSGAALGLDAYSDEQMSAVNDALADYYTAGPGSPGYTSPVDYTKTTSGQDYTAAAQASGVGDMNALDEMTAFNEGIVSNDDVAGDNELDSVERILIDQYGWTDNGDGTVTNENGYTYVSEDNTVVKDGASTQIGNTANNNNQPNVDTVSSGGSGDVGDDPFATDPVATDPVVTDPVATDPVVTDPAVTDPVDGTANSVSSGSVDPTSELAADPTFSDTNMDGLVSDMEQEIANLRAQLASLSGGSVAETEGMSREEIIALIMQQMGAYNQNNYDPLSFMNAFGFAMNPTYFGNTIPSYMSKDGVYERRLVKDRDTGEMRYINVPIGNAASAGTGAFQQERRQGFGRFV